MTELILVLDFGGQYKELIARVTRGMNVYSEIKPGTLSAIEIKKLAPKGIILTGGPNSVYLIMHRNATRIYLISVFLFWGFVTVCRRCAIAWQG